MLASEIFKHRACQPPEARSFAGHPKDAPLWPAAARRPGHKAGALGVIPVRFVAGFGLPYMVGALRLPTLRPVSVGALRLPTLRPVSVGALRLPTLRSVSVGGLRLPTLRARGCAFM
ncbi:hypothetical protein C5942_10365 [Cronobacter sakazakii]|nr:hypothetical protein C5942_10365 [Cronobacter sakazakii]